MYNFRISTANDLDKLDKYYAFLRLNCPEFSTDIVRIKKSIDTYVQNRSRLLVEYRRTKSKNYLEMAQAELDKINPIIENTNQFLFIAVLSK